MNGKSGDHPITDIVRHHIAHYGDPLDTRIRELGELMSYQRLCDWFEQYWSKSPEQLEPIVAAKLNEVRRAVREGGWENGS
jgi:hypothetical protein